MSRIDKWTKRKILRLRKIESFFFRVKATKVKRKLGIRENAEAVKRVMGKYIDDECSGSWGLVEKRRRPDRLVVVRWKK